MDDRSTAQALQLAERLVEYAASEQREALLARVRGIVEHEHPAAANRRWLCELLRSWAPLEMLLSDRHADLARYRDLLLEHEYPHLLADLGTAAAVWERLRADHERLTFELRVASRLQRLLEPRADAASQWVTEHRKMSLALAEYLLRSVVDLPQRIPDALAHYYANRIAAVQNEIREQCRSAGSGAERQRGA
ncbi:MAG: hypothetical protein NZM12_06455 [Steroidobacteraceae bacterium]|nr:hypothetical protein [Steroidobacteraceae bacterium]MDW8258958.1 hypothetical protein [Gammaproteobacteria bacterium]